MAKAISNGRMKIAIVTVLILAAVAATVFLIIKKPSLMHLGLDLQGGVSVTMEAKPDKGETVSQKDMDSLVAIMGTRVNEFGVSEPLIQQEGDDRIIVELAGVSDAKEATAMLGKTAKLQFKDPDGNVVLDGQDLTDAYVSQNSGGGYVVALEFSKAGAKAFGEATTKYVNQVINIELDGEVISNPVVENPITNGKAVIEKVGDYDQCAELSALLRSGALPMDVEIVEERVVGPQLGADSLTKSYVAILYGIAAIFIFMILYYRLPGFLSCLALLVYALILFWIQSAINVTMTLPGIAAFLLSMGMAIDANIIIFERMKDELRKGKSLNGAVGSGFQRAFKAILDSNVTTLIATVVLFYFGVSSIKGFAITLSLGVLASMFTAIVFTRYLLNMCSRDVKLSKTSLYHS